MTQQPLLLTAGQVTRINTHSLLTLVGGQGIIEVDFNRYHFVAGEVLSLAPGQYVRLVVGDLRMTVFGLSTTEVSQYADTRVLFTHLISVAHVFLPQPELLTTSSPGALGHLVRAWQQLNPFAASAREIDVLFSLKGVIDEQFRRPVSLAMVSARLHEKPARINALAKDKMGITVGQLHHRRLLLEAQRQVVFSTATTKEISYDLGFREPAYFNRFFKLHTGKTPHQFRDEYPVADRDPFMADLLNLIEAHFTEFRPARFYADRLCLTVGTLARKLQQKSGRSLLQLIHNRQVDYARIRLRAGLPVMEVAFELGFREPNHFTAFFKNATGQTPTLFRIDPQKVHSFAENA